MGLDIVEFVMAVEESFDIRIPDRVAERIRTPRMLIDYVRTQLPASPSGRTCHTQRAFYAIRRALGGHHLRPGDARPREAWANVGRALNYKRWARLADTGWRTWFGDRTVPTTLGDAARELAVRSPYSFRRQGEGWSGGDVAAVVEQLCRDHFAINNYHPDHSFVEDWGAD